MKSNKLFTYYLLILLPIIGIIGSVRLDLINSSQFMGLFFFYLFIYRTYVDGKKLADKNLIPRKDIWKLIIPGYRLQFIRALYFR